MPQMNELIPEMEVSCQVLVAWLSKLYAESLSLFTVGWDTKVQNVSFMYTNLCVRVIQQPPANDPFKAHHGLWMNPGSKVPLLSCMSMCFGVLVELPWPLFKSNMSLSTVSSICSLNCMCDLLFAPHPVIRLRVAIDKIAHHSSLPCSKERPGLLLEK
jgi:hypothetical protein